MFDRFVRKEVIQPPSNLKLGNWGVEIVPESLENPAWKFGPNIRQWRKGYGFRIESTRRRILGHRRRMRGRRRAQWRFWAFIPKFEAPIARPLKLSTFGRDGRRRRRHKLLGKVWRWFWRWTCPSWIRDWWLGLGNHGIQSTAKNVEIQPKIVENPKKH